MSATSVMQAGPVEGSSEPYGAGLSPEQKAFAEATRQLLSKEWSTGAVREVATPRGDGHSPLLWERIVEAGWLSLAFPESLEGDGGSLVDLGVIVREAGRALVPTTFNSTLHAAFVLAEVANDEHVDRWLRPIVRGELLATVATAEAHAVHTTSAYETVVRRAPTGWRLDGRKLFVENASTAQLLVVVCRTRDGDGPGGPTLCLVEPQDAGVVFERHATFGHDVQDQVILEGVMLDEARVLGRDPAHNAAGLERASQAMAALTALEMIGGAQAVIEDTVAYLNMRYAFGKPVASFQAVQHLMAEAAMRVHAAELAAWQAVWRLSVGLGGAREVAIAKASAGRAYRTTTITAHQVWGGSGYTEESDLHLHSRRAVAADLRHGSGRTQLGRLADHLKR